MDLGECPKIHDLALRADYQQASTKNKDYFYDVEVKANIIFAWLLPYFAMFLDKNLIVCLVRRPLGGALHFYFLTMLSTTFMKNNIFHWNYFQAL